MAKLFVVIAVAVLCVAATARAEEEEWDSEAERFGRLNPEWRHGPLSPYMHAWRFAEKRGVSGDYPKSKAALPNAYKLLEKAQPELLEQLGGGGRAPFMDSYFANLALSTKKANVAEQVAAASIDLLQKQMAGNPGYYVSHGADHGVRVGILGRKMYEQIPIVRKALIKKYPAPAGIPVDKEGWSPYHQAIVDITNTLHDVGYFDLEFPDDSSPAKWLHAEHGKLLVKNSTGKALEEMFGPAVTADILNAIAEHNYDVLDCKTPDTPKCMFSFDKATRSRLLGPSSQPPKGYYRNYVPAPLEDKPLHYLVRVADNLEAQNSRLTPEQRKPEMLKAWLRLYLDNPLRNLTAAKNRVPKEPKDTYKERVKPIATQLADRMKIVKAEVAKTLKSQGIADAVIEELVGNNAVNEESFCHFGSNAVIDSVRFLVEPPPPTNPWNAFQKSLKNTGRVLNRTEAAVIYRNLVARQGARPLDFVEKELDFIELASTQPVTEDAEKAAKDTTLAAAAKYPEPLPSLGGSRLVMEVRFLGDVKGLRDELSPHNFQAVAFYQISRMADAATSCTIDGKPLPDTLTVRLANIVLHKADMPGMFLDATTILNSPGINEFPLRAFKNHKNFLTDPQLCEMYHTILGDTTRERCYDEKGQLGPCVAHPAVNVLPTDACKATVEKIQARAAGLAGGSSSSASSSSIIPPTQASTRASGSPPPPPSTPSSPPPPPPLRRAGSAPALNPPAAPPTRR